MRRSLVLALAVVLAAVPAAWAQLASGNVYGVVNDEQGGALPGASVNISGATIGARSTTSDSAGNFRFLNLDPGTYKLAVTLAGFATVNRDVIVNTGGNVNLAFGMKVAAMEETITVNAETPVIDTKSTGTSTNFTQDELSKIPNSRDPWALLRTVPGVIMDRVNVAGNESGQQSAFAAKGSAARRRGVEPGRRQHHRHGGHRRVTLPTSTTTRSRRSRSPPAATTSASSTGGVGLNFVTKRGTNSFHGTLRGYFTHEDLGSATRRTSSPTRRLPSARPARSRSRTTPPTTTSRSPTTASTSADPSSRTSSGSGAPTASRTSAWCAPPGALIDKTLLKDFNAKVNWQASGSDMVSVLWFLGAKEKFGRAHRQLRGLRRARVRDLEPGQLVPGQPVPRALQDRGQPHLHPQLLHEREVRLLRRPGSSWTRWAGWTAQAGISARLSQTFGTAQLSRFVRPQHTANVDGNYFTNGIGGSNEWKFGVGWRKTEALDQTLWPGDQVVAYDTTAHQPARPRQPRRPGHQPDRGTGAPTWATRSPRTG